MRFAPVVEVDFPRTGTWTNITRWVQVEDGIRITRGRGDEQSEIRPTTLSLTLDNRDGRFTPDSSASPYWPNVRKGRPIRCRVVTWAKNLVTNPGFEVDLTDWVAVSVGGGAPTLSRDNTAGQDGTTGFMRLTFVAGGSYWGAQSNVYGLDPGKTYTASAYVWTLSTSPKLRIDIAGTAGTANTVNGSWQRITNTFTATSTTHQVRIAAVSAPTAGAQAWVDSVQVEEGDTATTYDPAGAALAARFYGQVNEWPVSFAGGGNLVLSQVTATDTFKQLGKVAAMRSLLEQEILALSPTAYYTLGEPSDADVAGDTSGNGYEPLTADAYLGGGTGTLEFGRGIGPTTDGLSAVVIKPQSSSVGPFLKTHQVPVSSVVLACWINTTVKDRVFLTLWGSESRAITFKTNTTTGRLEVTACNDRGAVIATTLGTTNLADGSTHLVAVLVQSDGTITARIDGSPTPYTVVFSPDATYGDWVNMPAYGAIFVGAGPTFGGSGSVYDGTISHVYYARRVDMPDWSQVWAAGNPESTPNRFSRICRVLGITGTVRGSSSTQIAGQSSAGLAPAQALRDVAAVEGGLVYADRASGAVVLECRDYRQGRATSLTLAALREDDLRWSDDDQYVRNLVTHRRDGGSVQTWKDAASIETFGTYTDDVTLPWASDAEALNAAQWKVSNGADPPARITRASVVANTLPEHRQILGLDISDMVTLTDLPAGSPQEEVTVCVEGYSEVMTYNHHAITFNTSPAQLHRTWRLGVPGFSELGVSTKLGY